MPVVLEGGGGGGGVTVDDVIVKLAPVAFVNTSWLVSPLITATLESVVCPGTKSKDRVAVPAAFALKLIDASGCALVLE